MSSTGLPSDEALGSGQLWASPPGPDVRLSDFITGFLQKNDPNGEALSKPILTLPEEDDSHPFADYFISTSHNTYLLHNQLYGHASADSYTHVLSRHARCIEIDAWDSSHPLPASSLPPDVPTCNVIVTHGYTLVQPIPFVEVAVAIAQVVDGDPEGWPVWVSLENHTGHEGQREIVRVLEAVWGDRLVTHPLQGENLVTPRDLRGKIMMQVEWYPPAAQDPSQTTNPHRSTLAGLDSEIKKLVKDVDPGVEPKIIPELAALGVYAKSIKPKPDFLEHSVEESPSCLFNVSETEMKVLVTSPDVPKLKKLNTQYLMRVFPEGTRIDSNNLNPIPFWRAGAHLPALNWQTFDRGMQINEGFYSGTKGWILKPRCLRSDSDGDEGSGRSGNVMLRLTVVAACNVTRIKGEREGEETKIAVKGELLHSTGDVERETGNNSADASAAGDELVWDETLEWTYEDEELVHFRLVLVHKKWDGDTAVGVFTGRVDYIQQGWRLIQLLDMTGRPGEGVLLVRFEVQK